MTLRLPRLILRSCQSLPRRGCLTWHRHPCCAPYPTISTSAAATADAEGLHIPSLDTTYAYRWLRNACTCPSCIHPSTQQKLQCTSDIPASITPESVEISNEGVHISWAGPDRHRSFFPRALLTAHAHPSALHSLHNDVPVAPWPTTSALLAASGPDLEVPYDELATPRGLLRAITQLQRTGLLFVRDVPSSDTNDASCEIRKLAARFAEVRDTFYGDVWDVKTIDESRNIAYTSLFLGLHMDLQCELHQRVHFHDNDN
jgi:gamma-butyrobetaine dioxygenase